jgi:hypothetical protein
MSTHFCSSEQLSMPRGREASELIRQVVRAAEVVAELCRSGEAKLQDEVADPEIE